MFNLRKQKRTNLAQIKMHSRQNKPTFVRTLSLYITSSCLSFFSILSWSSMVTKQQVRDRNRLDPVSLGHRPSRKSTNHTSLQDLAANIFIILVTEPSSPDNPNHAVSISRPLIRNLTPCSWHDMYILNIWKIYLKKY